MLRVSRRRSGQGFVCLIQIDEAREDRYALTFFVTDDKFTLLVFGFVLGFCFLSKARQVRWQ